MRPIDVQRRFGETYCLHIQFGRVSQETNNYVAETSVNILKTTWRRVSEDNALNVLDCNFERWSLSSFICLFIYSCLV
jgi:hypothetical protein